MTPHEHTMTPMYRESTEAEAPVQDSRVAAAIRWMQNHPLAVRATAIGGAVLAAVQPVAADMNWTPIGNMLEGLSNIMPSVGNLVMAVVPVLITLMVVGFITGLLDGIIDAIRAGTRLFK